MPVTPSRRLTFWPLFGVIYLLVCGGPYGIEEMVSATGPGAAFVLLVLAPLVWGLPMALVVIDTILFSAGYILLFFTLLRFRALFPDAPRPLRIPGGRVGVWMVAVLPTLVAVGACLAADFKETGPGLAAAASGPLAYLVVRRVRHTAT
jgi:hypothetical protein